MSQNRNQQHPILTEMLSSLDEWQHEFYEERAAILEYDDGISRALAETVALLEVIRLTGWPPNRTG